jgi:hypothetical protein
MLIAHKQYTATESPFTIDLRLIEEGVAGHVFMIADFDIEVLGNAAAVTVKGKGPFANSVELDITDGTFAIAGGKRKTNEFALGSLIFTSAEVPFSVNVIRRIKDQ